MPPLTPMLTRERNELRLAALGRVKPADRKKLTLGRLLEVRGDDEDDALYFLNLYFADGIPWAALKLKELTALPLGLDVAESFGGLRSSDPKKVREFLAHPELAKVAALDFFGAMIRAGSKGFETADLGALTWLNLGDNAIQLGSLLACKSLGNLRHLNVTGNDVDSEGVLSILKTFGKLTSLDVTEGHLGDGFEKVIAAPELGRVEALRLGPCDRKDWSLLKKSKQLGGLRQLAIRPSRTDKSGAALLGHAGFKALEDLNLHVYGTALGKIALPALRRLTVQFDTGKALSSFAADPALARLDHLTLSVPRTAMLGMPALYKSAGFKKLRSLALHFNEGVPPGDYARDFCSLPAFERLERLELRGLAVDDANVPHLLANRPFKNLVSLTISGQMGPGGARALAEHADLAGLEELRLGGKLRDEGVTALAKSPHVKNLRVLDVSGAGLTDEGARAVAESDNLREVIDLRLGDEFSKGVRALLAKHARMPKVWILQGAGELDDPELRESAD